ncbi:MAG: hypothetical protein F6K58_07420 [Symploca sp. SIO2E9]|nr:hypothetical protein [Symploca sp. SIO2E9]
MGGGGEGETRRRGDAERRRRGDAETWRLIFCLLPSASCLLPFLGRWGYLSESNWV